MEERREVGRKEEVRIRERERVGVRERGRVVLLMVRKGVRVRVRVKRWLRVLERERSGRWWG